MRLLTRTTPAAPAAAANHAIELTGPMIAAACVGVAEGLRQPDREEALEGDHREAPEQLDPDEREQDARTAQQPDPVADDARHRAHGAGDRADPARDARLAHERDDGDEVHDAEPDRDEDRQRQRRRRRRTGRARRARPTRARRPRWRC